MKDVTILSTSPLITEVVPRSTHAPHLSKHADKRKLYKDFKVVLKIGSQEHTIVVPKGYISDGASIPRVFHRAYHPFATESYEGAVLHDYIYSHLYGRYSKRIADALLRALIKYNGGSWFMQNSFYCAVRLNVWGGGWAWDVHG